MTPLPSPLLGMISPYNAHQTCKDSFRMPSLLTHLHNVSLSLSPRIKGDYLHHSLVVNYTRGFRVIYISYLIVTQHQHQQNKDHKKAIASASHLYMCLHSVYMQKIIHPPTVVHATHRGRCCGTLHLTQYHLHLTHISYFPCRYP